MTCAKICRYNNNIVEKLQHKQGLEYSVFILSEALKVLYYGTWR